MDFEIISASKGTARISSSGGTFLAIESGLKNRAFVGVDTSRLQSLPGLIVCNGEIRNWMIEGVTEIGGITYFYGPDLEGKSLASAEFTPSLLLTLSNALHTIKDRNFPVRQFSLTSVYLVDDGSILFFPPRLMEFLNSHRTRTDSMDMIEPWNNPALGGEAGRSFTIAALSYRILTDRIPFAGESEEEIEKLISKKNYPSPLLSVPGLRGDLLQLIDESFSGEGSLGRWRDMLNLWDKEGAVDKNLSAEETAVLAERADKAEKSRIRSLKTAGFFLNNRSKLIAAAAVLVVLAMILQAPLSKYFAPPVTLGMSQEEVVALYYNCFKTLDTEVLEDTITSQAGKGDINEISTIYVTSRVRSSYEGTSGLLDPETWIAEGMNPVEPGIQVWGISDLKIMSIGNDSFEATYTKWTPAVVEDIENNSPRMPVGTPTRDILHLSLEKEAWIIDRMNRIKE